MESIAEKLKRLRQLMQKHRLDFYFVPARDPHNNEYVPACWQRRAFISSFTGSAGDALIGLDKAYLWTDGRYFLQADQELDKNCFQLMKQAQGAPPIHQWFLKNAQGKTCGVDPQLITVNQAQQWQEALEKVNGKLIALEKNLIDETWENKPTLPQLNITQYPLQHAGLTAKEKIEKLRQKLTEQNHQAYVLTMLDAIAWLFNIRGLDVEYNPLVISYAIITKDKTSWYVDSAKLTEADKLYLKSQGISHFAYTDFQTDLNRLTGKICIDANTASWWVEKQLSNAQLVLETSPINLMKAIKNPIELAGMHEAHRLDAIAMVKFFHWLEENWSSGVDEISAAVQLESLRRQNPACLDLSFATISGFAGNGAVIHYKSSEKTNRRITDEALYLIDSGGQYFAGTTDITRTIHLGIPTEKEKYHYTLVLKGHLALRHAIFPAGTCGEHLDVLARLPLWKAGLNYAHGTGHGVGCYLCVHEGPQRISPAPSQIALAPNMIVSNEPGIYFPEKYGIRIENLCAVAAYKEHESTNAEDSTYYCFEDLTKVPYARSLIDLELLTAEEIEWINHYHQETFDLLVDDLDPPVRDWLTQATAPL